MNNISIVNIAYMYYIAIAMLILSVAIFTKSKKRKKLAITVFSVIALYLIFIRYGEKGVIFIKQDLIPFVCTVAVLIIGYSVLDFIDKKFPEKNKKSNNNFKRRENQDE